MESYDTKVRLLARYCQNDRQGNRQSTSRLCAVAIAEWLHARDSGIQVVTWARNRLVVWLAYNYRLGWMGAAKCWRGWG